MRYDGFISYSHSADGLLAPALQKALQRLAKPWYRRRSLEIFRDETGLSVDPHLWKAIVRALDDSEWFLLLTSPLAAKSEWVNREIDHWKANRSVDRILPIVTDGHWQWDEATGDFTPDSDAVPPSLRGVFTDEPRHLDLRWAHDDAQLDLHNGRFRSAAAEVAAPLHGRTKDDIEGEDVRQHRRTVRIAWSAASILAVLTVAAVVAGSLAVVNANRAEQRRLQAESQRLSNYSQNETAASDLAFLLAAQGYRLNSNALTETALFRAVTEVPAEIEERIATSDGVSAVAVSAAADRIWIGTGNGDVSVRRLSDGTSVAEKPGYFKYGVVAITRIGTAEVAVTDGTAVATLDGDLNPALTHTAPGALSSLAAAPSTGELAAGSVVGAVFIWSPEKATPTTTFQAVPDVAATDYVEVTALAWTPDRGVVVASRDGALRRFDPNAPQRPVWEHRETTDSGTRVSALTVLDDGTVVTGKSDGTVEFRNGSDGALIRADSRREHAGTVRGITPTGDTPENGSVASVADDGYLVFWNHLTGERALAPVSLGDVSTSVAWDPSDPLQGVTGGQSGVTVLDYGRSPLPSVARELPGWADVAAVAMAPTGDRLAVVRTPQSEPPRSELVLTDPANPDPNDPSVDIEGVVEQLVFSPDGRVVLASTGTGRVAVWDGQASGATTTEVAPGQIVSQLAVSPDGGTVATGSLSVDPESDSESPVRLWRLDGLALTPAGDTDVTTFGFGLAFTPDGGRLVIGGSNGFTIHPLDGGDPVTVELKGDMPRSLAVAPGGRTVAVGLYSGPVRFFDLATGRPTGDELRQTDRAAAIAFRDDDVLVTASATGSFKLWDLVSQRSLSARTLSSVDTASTKGLPTAPSLALGPRIAITASLVDGRLIEWSLDPEAWIEQGCEFHQRELTGDEKDRFDLAEAPPVCPVR